MKFKFESSINTFNIFSTLILAFAALFISYNSYKLSERQNTLEEGQQQLELKNSILELINTSSMLRQTEKDYPNIKKCVETFTEMKSILESQLKNKLLFENRSLADKWTELLMDINFNIKFFQPGTSPNVIIDGAYLKVKEIESECSGLFKQYNQPTTPE